MTMLMVFKILSPNVKVISVGTRAAAVATYSTTMTDAWRRADTRGPGREARGTITGPNLIYITLYG